MFVKSLLERALFKMGIVSDLEIERGPAGTEGLVLDFYSEDLGAIHVEAQRPPSNDISKKADFARYSIWFGDRCESDCENLLVIDRSCVSELSASDDFLAGMPGEAPFHGAGIYAHQSKDAGDNLDKVIDSLETYVCSHLWYKAPANIDAEAEIRQANIIGVEGEFPVTESSIRFDDSFLTEAERLQDFEYLFSTISRHYPYFDIKTRMGYRDWRERRDEWRELMREAQTPELYYDAVEQVLKGLHNLHAQTLLNGEDGFIQMVANDTSEYHAPYRDVLEHAIPAVEFWGEVGGGGKSSSGEMPRAYYIDGSYVIADRLRLEDGTVIDPGSKIVGLCKSSVDDYIEENRDDLYLVSGASSDTSHVHNLFELIGSGDEIEVDTGGVLGTIRFAASDVAESEKCITHRAKMSDYLYLDLIPGEVAYVKLHSFGGQYDAADAKRFAQFVEKHRDDKALILDIRGNGGGDSRRWQKDVLGPILDRGFPTEMYLGMRQSEYLEPFKEVNFAWHGITLVPTKEYPENVPAEVKDGDIGMILKVPIGSSASREEAYTPRIYLLVDRDVYSSSEMFAAWARASGRAVIVGERTGGDGIGVTCLPAVLPNSRLAIFFPWVLGMFSDGTADEEFGILPHIETEWSVKTWKSRCASAHQGRGAPGSYEALNDKMAREVLLEHDPDIAAVLKDLDMKQ